jgi:anti-anti-sigma factor
MDAAGSRRLRTQFEELAEASEDVVLDLSGVDVIDSAGVGALVFLLKRLRKSQRNLSIENLSGQPRELFELMNLDAAFGLRSPKQSYGFADLFAPVKPLQHQTEMLLSTKPKRFPQKF